MPSYISEVSKQCRRHRDSMIDATFDIRTILISLKDSVTPHRYRFNMNHWILPTAAKIVPLKLRKRSFFLPHLGWYFPLQDDFRISGYREINRFALNEFNGFSQ